MNHLEKRAGRSRAPVLTPSRMTEDMQSVVSVEKEPAGQRSPAHPIDRFVSCDYKLPLSRIMTRCRSTTSMLAAQKGMKGLG